LRYCSRSECRTTSSLEIGISITTKTIKTPKTLANPNTTLKTTRNELISLSGRKDQESGYTFQPAVCALSSMLIDMYGENIA
jgi:hypothetical protein